MAWFNKTGEATKEPEQDKAAIDSLVERLGASIEEKMKPMRESVSKLETRWNELEQAAAAPPPPEKKDPADPAVEPDRWKQENLTPLAIGQILTNARITESEVINEIAGTWPEQLPEIKDYFSKADIAIKAKADYGAWCRNVVKVVIGGAAMKSGLRYDGQGKRFFLETNSGAGAATPGFSADMNWVKPNGKVVTGEETLRGLGIDPEEFRKTGVV
jgi:hypothetical protein